MQIQPGKQFTIARQLGDPADTNTYYVRAYIRKASDDSSLATVDLTNKGDQRFRGVFDVPYFVDPVYITVTTKVFTDSGYTTESQDYQRVENLYLVQSRVTNMGGGGDVRIDYKKLAQTVKDLLPEPKETDLSFIKAEFKNLPDIVKKIVMENIQSIKIPEYKPQKIEFPPQIITDLSPVLSAISKLEQSISRLENADLEPIISYLHDLEKVIKESKDIEEFKKSILDISKSVSDFITETKAPKLKTFEEVISEIKNFNGKQTSVKTGRKFKE